MPAATGNPKRAEPEHREITAGRTPASSRARAAPTTEARAPLPPVAMSARRLPSSQSARKGCGAGNGRSSTGRGRSPGRVKVARRTSSSRPASSRMPSTHSRAAVITLKYWRSRNTSRAALSTGPHLLRCGPAPMTSAKPSDRHSNSSSSSGTAVVSTVMPMQHDAVVGEEGGVHGGADGGAEGVVAGDPRPAEEDRVREPGDVAGQEVHVLEHAADDRVGHEVQCAGDGVGEGQRPLRSGGPAARADGAHAADRVRRAQRHPQPLQGDPVAARGVVGLADADGQRHRQLVDGRAVALVVAAQAAGDAGHEAVVERPAGGGARLLQLVQTHGDRVQDPSRPALGHDRREHGRERRTVRPMERAVSTTSRAGAQRMAHDTGRWRPARAWRPGGIRRAGGRRGRPATWTTRRRAADLLTGRRRGQRIADGVVRLRVEERQGELHAPDPVGQGVVHLHDDGGPAVLQPSTSVNSHSGRVWSKPLMAASAASASTSSRPCGAGRVDPAQVPGDVEVRVGRPARRGQAGRASRPGAAGTRGSGGSPAPAAGPGPPRRARCLSQATPTTVERSSGSFSMYQVKASFWRMNDEVVIPPAIHAVRGASREQGPPARPIRAVDGLLSRAGPGRRPARPARPPPRSRGSPRRRSGP